MVANYVLRLRWRVAINEIRPWNRRFTSPNDEFEYSYIQIEIMLIQRHHVESTIIQCCFKFVRLG